MKTVGRSRWFGDINKLITGDLRCRAGLPQPDCGEHKQGWITPWITRVWSKQEAGKAVCLNSDDARWPPVTETTFSFSNNDQDDYILFLKELTTGDPHCFVHFYSPTQAWKLPDLQNEEIPETEPVRRHEGG